MRNRSGGRDPLLPVVVAAVLMMLVVQFLQPLTIGATIVVAIDSAVTPVVAGATFPAPAGFAIVNSGGTTLAPGSFIVTTRNLIATPGACPATPSSFWDDYTRREEINIGAAATPRPDTIYSVIVGPDEIEAVGVTVDATGQPALRLLFTPSGAAKMEAFTSTHLGQPMALVLDDRVVISPVIQATVVEEAQISGIDEAILRHLVVYLRQTSVCANSEVGE